MCYCDVDIYFLLFIFDMLLSLSLSSFDLCVIICWFYSLVYIFIVYVSVLVLCSNVSFYMMRPPLIFLPSPPTLGSCFFGVSSKVFYAAFIFFYCSGSFFVLFYYMFLLLA